MSVKVELEKLLEVAAGFGTVPMLLTTDEDGRPRASAVSVSWDGVTARVRAGRKSVANAAARPLVSLLWPAPPGERFALLVDGSVRPVIHATFPLADVAAAHRMLEESHHIGKVLLTL